MARFAEADFALNVKQEDGYSLRHHLVSGWQQSGIKPQELKDAPPLPDLTAYLWAIYLKLHRRRKNYGWGHTSLGYDEICAFMQAENYKLKVWEIDAICEIDNAYIRSIAKKSKG